MSEYVVVFYRNSRTGREPVLEYLNSLRAKEHDKVLRHIELLRVNEAKLAEPYAKHIGGKIWELRVQFSPNQHRILYVVAVDKLILLLHAFTKHSEKLPPSELGKASKNLEDFETHKDEYYED